jgi:hypothetical protein
MSVIATLNNLMNEVKVNIQNSLDQKGLTNTGKTKQELSVSISERESIIIGMLSGPAHLAVLEGGASPITKKTTGKYIESIALWGQTKLGLNEKEAKGLAFAMLRKRLGSGTAGNTVRADGTYFVPNPFNSGGVLSENVNDQVVDEIMKRLLKDVAAAFVEGIKVQKK